MALTSKANPTCRFCPRCLLLSACLAAIFLSSGKSNPVLFWQSSTIRYHLGSIVNQSVCPAHRWPRGQPVIVAEPDSAPWNVSLEGLSGAGTHSFGVCALTRRSLSSLGLWSCSGLCPFWGLFFGYCFCSMNPPRPFQYIPFLLKLVKANFCLWLRWSNYPSLVFQLHKATELDKM